jgi:hypothetical protein
MSVDQSVTATFQPRHGLVVAVQHCNGCGEGEGAVTSSPAGISCPPQCHALFDQGVEVTLTATPDPGSTFKGWSGAGCSGTGTCTVTMSSDQAVTARFDNRVVADDATGITTTSAVLHGEGWVYNVGMVGAKGEFGVQLPRSTEHWLNATFSQACTNHGVAIFHCASSQVVATGLSPATTYSYQFGFASVSGAFNGPDLGVSSFRRFTTSSIATRRVATLTDSRVSAKLTCATSSQCTGTATLGVNFGGLSSAASIAAASGGRKMVLGTGKFRIRGKHSATIVIHLTKRGRHYLQRYRTAKVQLRTRVRVGGKIVISTQALKLRRR